MGYRDFPEDCGQKTKNVVPGIGAGHVRCQNTDRRRSETNGQRRDVTEPFAWPYCSSTRLFAICGHPSNPLLPPALPTARASAGRAGFGDGCAAGEAQPLWLCPPG